MKSIYFYFIFFSTCLNLSKLSAQHFKITSAEEMMKVGVYYYPEQWKENQWERDIKNISQLGFEFIHMGEFAWAFLEPEEGKYNFLWLDKAIEIADRYKLKVILCTPSPCPPAWLASKHPDMFNMNNMNMLTGHGARANGSRSSEIFLSYSQKIARELGKRYGKDKRIWGWQIDNEPGAPKDYSKNGVLMFQKWLKSKYNTIDSLNKCWGAAFWSLQYNSFEQIVPPNLNFLWGASPHAVLDFNRFTNEQDAKFLDLQASALRENINSSQWITTNYIALDDHVDRKMTKQLDFISYTMYPVGRTENIDSLRFRTGNNNGISFGNDYFRTFKNVYGVMEIQPGQVNWAPINSQPLPGAVRMWLWHIFAGNSKFACTYRYRQPIFGSELYHAGITKTDGVTLSQGGKEFKKMMEELKYLRSRYVPQNQIPKEYQNRQSAILWNTDNIWDIENQKQTVQWKTQKHIFKYHQILKSYGAPVDFIQENQDFSKYKFLVVPAYQLLDSGLVKKLEKFASDGGNLLVTCRTGQKDRNGQLWEGKFSAPILNLIGSEILFYDALPDYMTGKIRYNDSIYNWSSWAEILKPYNATVTLATFANQYYEGNAVATQRNLGKGKVYYIGVDTKDGKLESEILKKMFVTNNTPIESYPEGVYVEWRDGFWVAVNYSAKPYDFKNTSMKEILIGKLPLTTAEVLIWR